MTAVKQETMTEQYLITPLGDVTFGDDDIYHFKKGLVGSQEAQSFIMATIDGGNPDFRMMINKDTPSIMFMVLTLTDRDRISELMDLDDFDHIQQCFQRSSDALALGYIVSISNEDGDRQATLNQKAPLVFDLNNNEGVQIILESSSYNINLPFFNQTMMNQLNQNPQH